MDKWIKPVFFLALIIVFSSAGIRLLTKGETLSNYADQNPEIAYASPDRTASPIASTDGTPSPFPSSSGIFSTESSRK